MKGNIGWPALLALLLVLAGCRDQRAPEQATSQAGPSAATALPATSQGGVVLPPVGSTTVRASGKVVPARHAVLSFVTAGRVQQVAVEVGDRVEAGAVLVILDDAAAAAAVSQAQAALYRAQAQAQAAAEVAEAEAALARAQADLANTRLRAPFAGTVTSIHVTVGEVVQPGQPILTLADLDHLQVETTDLSERDVARVTVGQAATVFVEALNTEIPARVIRIAPEATVIGGDVVYPVLLELETPPPGLRWGMSADVTIPTD